MIQQLIAWFETIFQSSSQQSHFTPVSTPEVPATPASQEDILTLNGQQIRFKRIGSSKVEIAILKPVCVIRDLEGFGKKLLPTSTMKWKTQSTLDATSIPQAAHMYLASQSTASVMKSATPKLLPSISKSIDVPTVVVDELVESQAAKAPYQRMHQVNCSSQGQQQDTGILRFFGEKEFPDRSRKGKTYESYCVILETASCEVTRQGEGLREAICDSNAQLGQLVNVVRSHQITVPALCKRTSRQLLDDQGQPKTYQKWVWQISISN